MYFRVLVLCGGGMSLPSYAAGRLLLLMLPMLLLLLLIDHGKTILVLRLDVAGNGGRIGEYVCVRAAVRHLLAVGHHKKMGIK